MSRSNPTSVSSPATRFFEWAAEKGELRYYDKEKSENVTVKLPFSFLVLDEVSQVGGGVKVNGKYEGYWSNAVKNLNAQIITVRSKAGVVAQGLYSELKERKGLHYVKGLYIAFYDENKTLQIGYLKFKGSSLSAWFDYIKAHRNIYQGAFTIKSKSDVIEGDKGDYYQPVFAHKADISEESDLAAKELDKTVQDYLTAYFAHKGDETEEVVPETTGVAVAVGGRFDAQAGFNPSEEDPDDIPF
jgi:hypothetical protein